MQNLDNEAIILNIVTIYILNMLCIIPENVEQNHFLSGLLNLVFFIGKIFGILDNCLNYRRHQILIMNI